MTAPDGPPPRFSPALARGKARRVRAAEVTDLLPLTHAAERVVEYREALVRGEVFPPVAVVRVLGRWVIADGHKRWSALSELSVDEVVVDVWSPRHLALDQLRQLRNTGRKWVRLLASLRGDRQEARRIVLDTLGHWRRVAASIFHVARRRT